MLVRQDGIWRITKKSPALDGATGSFPIVTHDIDGQLRGEAKDVGADEFSALPSVNRPLTAEDVGPNAK